MTKKSCYFNGEFINFEDVKISPSDLGFLRGYGIFDAMRTFGKKPFLLTEHWDRIVNSVQELNMEMPINKGEFASVVDKLIGQNGFENSSVRTVITGGVSENGITRGGNPTILISIDNMDLFYPAKELFEKGISLASLNFRRFLPRAKTLNYIAVIKEQERKEEMGAQEIVYIKNGIVLEGATSNIFIVKDGKLITSIDDILLGTVRNLVVKLAKDCGIEVEERKVSEEDLFSADEAFITGTYKWVLPVVSVDDKIIGSGKVGVTTKKIMKIISNFVEKY